MAEQKAYSYIRFSTPGQEKGDSIRRQTEYSEQVATKLGLVLDDSMRLTDRGLSAYKGDHRTKGALGEFLNYVDQGKITPGSVLIIEALDRLSREGMLEAIHLLTGILLKGIDLYTAMDDKHFQKSTYDLADLIISATKLQQGHEESEKKSQRLSAAWVNKRNQATNGDRKLTGRCPSWLQLSDDKKSFIVLPEIAQTIKQIFEMKLQGKGTWAIERELNQLDIWKPLPTKRNKAGGWRKSYIDKILRNPAVHGEYQPHRKVNNERIPDGEPIKDYYPPIVDKDLFNRVQEIIRHNQEINGNNGGRNGTISNLFGYIAICPKCKGPMAFVNKGKDWQYLQCDKARRGLGCDKTTIRYNLIETPILTYCKGLNVEDILPNNEKQVSELSILKNQLQAVDGELSQIQNKLNNTLDSISTTDNKNLRKVLEDKASSMLYQKTGLENRKDDISKKIEKASSNGKATKEQLRSIQELIDRMNKLEGKDRQDLRLNLRNQLRRLIDKMRIFPDKKQIAIFFKTGERRSLSITDGQIKVLDAYPKGRT
jgi:DNA invertase Pin-like site-specific DNA recombinase